MHDPTAVVTAGAALDTARAVMIAVHGRNSTPANIISLADRLDRPQIAVLAPAATTGAWYPFSFMAPRDQNEPGISSGLGVLETLVQALLERGVVRNAILLMGFSQGACLASEFVVRHPRRYGGLIAFSGGLIGPWETDWDNVDGELGGMPAFLGCSDVDAHVPAARVAATESVLARMGADVTCRIYPGMGHVVNDDEILAARALIDNVTG